jgi:hypothetical protein
MHGLNKVADYYSKTAKKRRKKRNSYMPRALHDGPHQQVYGMSDKTDLSTGAILPSVIYVHREAFQMGHELDASQL